MNHPAYSQPGKTGQLLCAHSALAFVVFLAIGVFGFAGWLPPVLPSRSADEIAQMFQQDGARIRIGMALLAFGCIFWWPLAAAISAQMKRIEGYRQHPLAAVQLTSASGTVVALLMASFFWLVAAYRPDTMPATTIQMFHDYGWFCFIGMYPPIVLQVVAIGICILMDRSSKPVYPRWVGFANFWIALGFMPGALVPFFKTGPFAWNGVLAFWLVAVLFFAWILMMWWTTVQAIQQPERAEEQLR